MKRLKKLPVTKADILLFALLVAAGAAGLFLPSLIKTSPDAAAQMAQMSQAAGGSGLVVFVTVNGDAYGAYPLGEDRRIEIRQGEGTVSEHCNVLIIENGTVRMEYSDCKNQICVHAGEKQRRGEQIVCLPNRVFAEIIRYSTPEQGDAAQTEKSDAADAGSREEVPGDGRTDEDDGFDAITR